MEPDEPLFADLLAAPAPMTIAKVVQAFANANTAEDIFALLKDTDSPADPIDQQLVRFQLVEVLKRWKIPVKAVDEWFRVKAIERATAGIVFAEYERWPDPVDGVKLLSDIEAYFRKFVHAPEESILATSLWTIWTHVFDLFDIAPLLVLTSPTKKCGKTTLLRLIGSVCARCLFSSNATGPAIFRVIEKYRPTLLIDEADNFAVFNDELKGLLNAGHERMTAQVIRTVGDDHDVRTFSTWAPKAFTAIGALPDPLEDRSVRVVMLRKPSDLQKDRARRKALAAEGDPLARRCARWAEDNAVTIRAATEPVLPNLRDDRAADNWAPLIVIAEMCGARDRAEQAAAMLTGAGDMGVDELLLLHVREAFGDLDRIGTTELIESLVARDDGPWPKWWADDVGSPAGRKKAAAALARRLRKFDPGLKAERKREGEERERGYDRVQFEDAWSRWLPPIEPDGDPEPDHLPEGPETLALLSPLGNGPDLGPGTGPVTSGNGERVKRAKGDKVSEARESLDGPKPGDIIRVDAHRAARFRVKAVTHGTVDCWQLEAGMAFKERFFPLADVHIVERAKEA
jgi:Protein of unknown function (DUF3631)